MNDNHAVVCHKINGYMVDRHVVVGHVVNEYIFDRKKGSWFDIAKLKK